MNEGSFTGFTFTVNGSPEAVERLWKATESVLNELMEEARTVRDAEALTIGLPSGFLHAPALPVRAKVRFRHTIT